jgi:hypothetical protein
MLSVSRIFSIFISAFKKLIKKIKINLFILPPF